MVFLRAWAQKKAERRGKKGPESNSGRKAKWEQLETWKTDYIWQ